MNEGRIQWYGIQLPLLMAVCALIACGLVPTPTPTRVQQQATVQAMPTDTRAPQPGPRMTPIPSVARATATRTRAPTAPPPPMPLPKTCATESKPFWHWQAGSVHINDFFFTTFSTGFAVGDPYTLLRTDDGGSNWVVWPIDSLRPLNAIHFSSPKTGWVAGDGGTILQTTDSGRTWQPQQTGTKANLFVIKFLDDKIGWAGGSNGTLLRATDSGVSWVAGETGQQMDVVDIAFIDAQEGYLVGQVGTGVMNYVLHTSDGGATWQNTEFSGARPETIYAAKGATPWVAGGWVANGVIWKGIGPGWQTKVTEIARWSGCHFREIVFSDAQHGWAVGDCGLAVFTQDGGKNWQPMQVPEETSWKTLRFISERDVVLAGYNSLDGIHVAHSSDGGQTWSAAPSGASFTGRLEVPDMDFVDPWFGWAVGIAKSHSVEQTTGLLRTIDGGQSWERHELPGGQVRQIEFVDRLRGWALGEGGLVARTDDGGKSWAIQSVAFPEDLQAISFVDRDHGWIISAETGPGTCQEYSFPDSRRLTLFRTSSGGDEWEGPICIKVASKATSPLSPLPPHMRFVDQETGWIVATQGLILKTTDGGLTWQPQTSGVAVDLTDVYFTDAQTGWITGDKGVLLGTSDGGGHWKQQRLGDYKLTGVRFVDGKMGWVTSGRYPGQVFSSSDGGQTWKAMSVPEGGMLTLAAADEYHIWLAKEGGITAYVPVCLSPPNP